MQDESKLAVFMELCLEKVVETVVSELAYFWGQSLKSKLQSIMANFTSKKGKLLAMVTIAINLVVITSYQPGSCPLCADAFRTATATWVFRTCAPAHALTCTVAFGSWCVVRAPVLLHRSRRAKLVEALSGDGSGLMEDDAGEERLMEDVQGLRDAIWEYLKLTYEPEFILNIFSIATSIAGVTYTPFLYSFHMFTVVYNSDLEIVLSSFTGNWRRLSTVFMFMVLVMLLFAISAFMIFENADDMGDESGRCTTLLQCFTSYTYRGLTMSSLGNYLPEARFPTNYTEVLTKESARLVWETSFTLVTVSMLGENAPFMSAPPAPLFPSLRMSFDTSNSNAASGRQVPSSPVLSVTR